MYIWIILLCGTLCIIFGNQIIDILFRYCHLDSFCDLDRFFLSKKEREIKKEQLFFLSASPSELLPIYNEIIKKYSKQSLSKNKDSQILKFLPNEIFSFFSKYDAVCIKHRNFVDIRELKKLQVNDKKFIIIGRDPESLDFFVVESLENETSNHLACILHENFIFIVYHSYNQCVTKKISKFTLCNLTFFYPVFTLRAAASRHICFVSLEFAVCLYSFTQRPHSYALLPSCNMQVSISNYKY